MPADQIEQREQEDPDDVDKVPVEPEILNEREMPVGISTCSRTEDHEAQNPDANDHVQRVHAGHGEVEKEVKLRVASHVQRQGLVMVLRNIRVRCRVNE